jgi:glycosyltransferase involved in cell wall biosynthesis
MNDNNGIGTSKKSPGIDSSKIPDIFRRIQKKIYPFGKSHVKKIVEKNNFLVERNKLLLNRIKYLEEKHKLLNKKTTDKNAHLRGKILEKNAHFKKTLSQYSRYNLVFYTLKFADIAYSMRQKIEADVYITHEILPIAAADLLVKDSAARIICDVVEYPRLDVRTIPPKHSKSVLSMVHAYVDGYLKKCSQLLTVSESLGNVLEDYGVPISVIQNYRYAEKLEYSNKLRTLCKLKDVDKLILCISIVASDFELILDAMELLDENIHLAMIGRLTPPKYKEKIISLIEEKNLSDRIHFFKIVPYEELTTLSSGADIGIIVRNQNVLNNWVSLPNRVFDFICSGLPICSPDIPDISKIIKHYNAGRVVEERTAEAWANAIMNTLENRDELSNNAIRAANECTWESIEKTLYNAVGNAKKVTFLGLKDLTKNNRTKRMARTLARKGIKVDICCLSESECFEPESELIKFHTIDPKNLKFKERRIW